MDFATKDTVQTCEELEAYFKLFTDYFTEEEWKVIKAPAELAKRRELFHRY